MIFDELNLDDFQIEIKIKEPHDKTICALVTLNYLGMKIRGFRVNRKIDLVTGEVVHWVSAPQYLNHSRKKYSALFWLERDLWKKLEKRILDEYLSLVRRKNKD